MQPTRTFDEHAGAVEAGRGVGGTLASAGIEAIRSAPRLAPLTT
jgi:hypothetical protein